MRSAATKLTMLVAVLAALALAMPAGYCDGPEEPITDPPYLNQSQTFGSVDVVVLYADEDEASLRDQLEPKITALLTMTPVAEDEQCTIIVASRAPETQCCVVKSKDSK